MEIRELMERLSRRERHTILLCTHRLEDAEKLCNRVMIINKGKSVIVGTPDELLGKITGSPTLKVRLKKITHKILEAVKEIDQVKEVKIEDSGALLLITVTDIGSATPEVVKKIVYAGGLVLYVDVLRPSLEEAYLKLVKEG